MSYTAFYRKYRPKTFSEVVGQEHITKTLMGQLASGKIFHAYLFTGTRGTGKTSCAKILAKAVNCLNPQNGDPCLECESCRAIANGEVMDIVEIDAASNNSVDNIRELREQLQFTPANAKYRVYIIDEVHMLTISAFNALLKTLEEPPAHVIFVLATTEVHKLPATILSRCQRFDFKRIQPKIICDRICEISKKEDFSITENAACMIASIADGGMRDALSILDLCVAADKNITENTVTEVCGMAGDEYLLRFADYILNGEAPEALALVDELYNNSVDMLRLLSDLIKHFRNLMVVKTVNGKERPIVCSSEHMEKLELQASKFELSNILKIMRVLQDTTAKMQSGNRRSEMELMLIRLCTPELCFDFKPESASGEVPKPVLSGNITSDIPVRKKAEKPATDFKPEIAAEQTAKEPESITEANIDNGDINSDLPNGKLSPEIWKKILSELSQSAPLISGILNGSSAYINDQFLLIDTANTQFAELINGKNNLYREKLRKAIETVLKKSFKLGPYKKRSEQSNETDPLQKLKDKLKALEIPNADR